MKFIVRYDVKKKELTDYTWEEPGKPPPLIEPKIKTPKKNKRKKEPPDNPS